MEISKDIKGNKSPNTVKRLLSIILIIVIFIVGVGAGYSVYNRLIEKGNIDTNTVEQKEVEKIIDELGDIILLSDKETPTVAKLVDISELKKENEIFYENAKEGDLMIIYSDKAIIFRREEKKIVNVAPVYIETDTLAE